MLELRINRTTATPGSKSSNLLHNLFWQALLFQVSGRCTAELPPQSPCYARSFLAGLAEMLKWCFPLFFFPSIICRRRFCFHGRKLNWKIGSIIVNNETFRNNNYSIRLGRASKPAFYAAAAVGAIFHFFLERGTLSHIRGVDPNIWLTPSGKWLQMNPITLFAVLVFYEGMFRSLWASLLWLSLLGLLASDGSRPVCRCWLVWMLFIECAWPECFRVCIG